jgi:hypothetical protein
MTARHTVSLEQRVHVIRSEGGASSRPLRGCGELLYRRTTARLRVDDQPLLTEWTMSTTLQGPDGDANAQEVVREVTLHHGEETAKALTFRRVDASHRSSSSLLRHV